MGFCNISLKFENDMRDFFLNLSAFHVYEWSVYFDSDITEDNIILISGSNFSNARLVTKSRKTALSLPVTMKSGIIFVLSGTLSIISEILNKNILIREGEFVKYLSGQYMLEHSGNSKWIIMWLYENFSDLSTIEYS